MTENPERPPVVELQGENGETRSITYRAVIKADLERLKVLHHDLFPVDYTDKFFTSMLSTDDTNFAIVAISQEKDSKKLENERSRPIICGFVFGKVVGSNGVDLRIVGLSWKPKRVGYVQTIGVDPLYEGRGIASTLMRLFEAYFVEKFDVSAIFLHCHVPNLKGIEFYEKNDFQNIITEDEYYSSSESDRRAHIFCKYYHLEDMPFWIFNVSPLWKILRFLGVTDAST